MPTVINVPSRNYMPGRYSPVCAIVEHMMQGSLAGTDAWFRNIPSYSGVSAHFGVGLDGTIHKYVGTQNTAWHAGIVDRPKATLVVVNPGVNPNKYTIGIEHEGLSGQAFPDAQYQATLWLHHQLVSAYIIPIDRNFILRHSDIDADHAGCPGPTFPLDRLIADLKKLVLSDGTPASNDVGPFPPDEAQQ